MILLPTKNAFFYLLIISLLILQSGCGVPLPPKRWPAEVPPTRSALSDVLTDHAVLVVSYDVTVDNDPWGLVERLGLSYTVESSKDEYVERLNVTDFEPVKNNGKFYFLKVKPAKYRAWAIVSILYEHHRRRLEKTDRERFQKIKTALREGRLKWAPRISFTSGRFDSDPPTLVAGELVYVGSYQITLSWVPDSEADAGTGEYLFTALAVEDRYPEARQTVIQLLEGRTVPMRKMLHLLDEGTEMKYNLSGVKNGLVLPPPSK